MMGPKIKVPWLLLAKSWARALGHVPKIYTSNRQEVKKMCIDQGRCLVPSGME